MLQFTRYILNLLLIRMIFLLHYNPNYGGNLFKKVTNVWTFSKRAIWGQLKRQATNSEQTRTSKTKAKDQTCTTSQQNSIKSEWTSKWKWCSVSGGHNQFGCMSRRYLFCYAMPRLQHFVVFISVPRCHIKKHTHLPSVNILLNSKSDYFIFQCKYHIPLPR